MFNTSFFMIWHKFAPYIGLWKVPFIFTKANLLSSNLNHFPISSVLWVHIETVDLEEDMFPTGDNLSMKHPLMRSASVAMCVTTVTVFLVDFRGRFHWLLSQTCLIQPTLALDPQFRICDFSFGASQCMRRFRRPWGPPGP